MHGRYRSKVVEVDAIRYDPPKNCIQVYNFMGWPISEHSDCGPDAALAIDTKEGLMSAEPGDWIIREPFPSGDRDYYPVKPDIFKARYEEVVT